MADRARRKELTAEYKETGPDAGVYRIVNTRTKRSLLGSTTSLGSMRNRVEFAKSTTSASALDMRLRRDVAEHGIEAFEFEVLETLEVSRTTSRQQVLDDLATLEALWREKLGEGALY